DIATGTGAVATSAAQMLLPEGRVHGIDLSEKMLDMAFKNVQKMALSNIDLHTMDAEKPIFKTDYFHYITCSFGIFFLPDMPTALKNWQRIMQPDGKIIFSTFASDAFSPLTELFRARLSQFGIDIPEASWFKLSEPTECESLLSDAGYTNIKTEKKQMGYHLLSLDDWWDILWNTGYRGFINQLSASDLAKFRAEHLKEIEEFKSEDGLWLNIETIFSTANKPA
ncbi:MAG: class I SAM-dependent methyltransferase, partial [Gammaproteobacteria bacterium]|nr:class I SAM-dependent methyltransferase [Gammaproteobacteria bacterium]